MPEVQVRFGIIVRELHALLVQRAARPGFPA